MISFFMALLFYFIYINASPEALATPLTGKDAFGIIILVLMVGAFSDALHGHSNARK